MWKPVSIGLLSLIFIAASVASVAVAEADGAYVELAPSSMMALQTSGIMPNAASGDFQYEINYGEITITGYDGSDGDVVIPSYIDDTPVTSIGYYAFCGLSSLTSVTIPDGVTSIDDSAFYDCSSLTAIVVGEANEKYASLDGALYNKAMTTLITCPGGKTGAFTIPDGVTSIEYYAFYGCTSLTSVILPDSVTSIDGEAFSSCFSLTSIVAGVANANYASFDGVLYNKDMKTLIACPVGKTGAFTIPVTVTSIDDFAFFECSSLTKVIIPDSVTSIGDNAFYHCSSLTSITIPDSVTSIGWRVFESCSSLASISIGNGVTSIGNFAFAHCTSLTSITIPKGVTSIDDFAFSGCSHLSVMQFNGNAPSPPSEWGTVEPSLKAYYIEGATGFDSPSWDAIERIALTAPGAPTDLEAVTGAGEAYLTWVPPSNLGELISYEVWFGTSVDSGTWSLFATVNVLTATVTGLEHNTEYHFGVKAVNIAGASEFSSSSSITTLTYPDAPAITAAAGDGQVELTWDAPYDGGAAIIGYIIYHDGNEIARITDATKTSFVVNGLDNGVEHMFQVAAKNGAGIGDKSEAVSTIPRTVPDAPTDVVATLSDDHSSVTLVWKAPDFNGGSEIIGYEVWFRKSGSSSWTVLTDVNALTATINSLEHSSTYTFGVKAVNIAGASDLSTTSIATLATPDAPAVSVVADDGQVQLTWNVPYDGDSAIVEYIVYQYGAEIVRISETAYLVTDLINGVEHTFQVAARNAVGIGDKSEAVTVMPLPDVVPLYGKVVDTNGNGLASVTVSLENGASVTTADGGSFSFMASQGAHTLTISCGHILTTTSNVAVNGMELDVGAVVVNYAISGVFGDFEYTTAGGKIAITGYVGPGGDVIIPSTINAMPVTSIGSWAFQHCLSMASVTLSDSVTSIGNYAFYQCSSLTSVHIGIGVNSIGDGAFSGCNSLTSATIPDTVTYIGHYALSSCSSLTSITIPDSVTVIGLFVFSECPSMIRVDVSDANANYASLDGVLYNKGMTTLIACPGGKTGAFVIPDGVTSIDDKAFCGCSKLTSIVLPDGVTSIGWDAFFACSSLTSMIIPGGVESLGNYAFSLCSSLVSVTIGNGIITIGDEAFSLCANLTSIVIPDSVNNIGRSTFAGCRSLTNVFIGSGVTSIDDTAFSGCYNLTSIAIPSSVTSIGFGAFNACNNLTSIYFGGDAPGSPTAWRVIKPGLKVYYIDGAEGFNQSGWGVAELIALTAPGAPIDLEPTAEKGGAHLTWAAPSNDGGSDITGYEVWFGTSADSNTWTLLSKVDALLVTVADLNPGTTYYFGVKAVNFAGASELSSTLITTPNTITFDSNGGEGTVPEAITADHDSAVDLPDAGNLAKIGHTFGGWSLMIGGEAVIDPFTPTSDVTLYALWKINTVVPSAVSGLVYNGNEQTGVIDGTGYTLTGNIAINAGQYTATATLVNGYIWDDGTSDAKQITWAVAPREIIVTPDSQAKVFGDEDPTLTYGLSETVDVVGNLSRVAGEDVGTYTMTIGTLSAKNGNYVLKMISMAQFEIRAAYPAAPSITNVEPGNGQVMLSWTAPYDGGADIEIYIVYLNGEEIVRTTGITYIVAGLANGQAYAFQVAAKNAAGVGDISESVSATPLPAMAPISGKVVDGDGNGLAGVKVSLKDGTSVTTGDDGSFSIMASQGAHILTFSGENIETMTRNVTVDGMDFDFKSISVELRVDGDGDNIIMLAAIASVVFAMIIVAIVGVRLRK